MVHEWGGQGLGYIVEIIHMRIDMVKVLETIDTQEELWFGLLENI